MVIDSSSTDWVLSLRARTTPPNRAFMDEKTLFHVVPKAQQPVEGSRVSSRNLSISAELVS